MSAQILDAILHANERTALFIDGANLYSASKALGADLDYRKVLEEFGRRCRLVRSIYYTAIAEDHQTPVRPLVDWLDYNGYMVVTKPARDYVDTQGRRRFKGDMDVDITVDLLELAPHLEHVVLFSGDGDFTPAVEAVQRRGVRVTVVSSTRTSPPMAADELRRQADAFLELEDLHALIGREARSSAPQFLTRDDE